MLKSFDHGTIARWFFLILATAITYIFWQILEPYILVLITAAIMAVLLGPVESWLRQRVRHPRLSAAITMLGLLLLIVGPLTLVGYIMVQQGIDIATRTVANPDWRETLNFSDQSLFNLLPGSVRGQLEALNIDFAGLIKHVADWASANIGSVFAGSAGLIFKTFIFFVCLFYLLVDRDKIYRELLVLSPLRDNVDRNIVLRMTSTIRSVVFGSLIVASVQAILAAIGLTIFGVPGALLWAALVLIAAQIPMLGAALVLGPAVGYLLLTGHPGAALGLAIWSVIVVGLVDNILQPFIVGNKTRMHALLILLSILGGLEYFGPIGFILGPTVLAAFLAMVELYKAGILEKKTP